MDTLSNLYYDDVRAPSFGSLEKRGSEGAFLMVRGRGRW
jgi:hypothetical protein